MLKKVCQIYQSLVRRWKYWQDPVEFARSLGVRIGVDCRILGSSVGRFGTEPYLISIGNHVTITSGVKFITHDGGVWVFRNEFPDIDVFAPIEIGNNVFLGVDTIVLPGVSIGDNCVIGAGSVVTKNIPPNVVAAGIPARPLKTTDEYWEGVQKKSVHFRSLSKHEKRVLIKNHFLSTDKR